MEFAASRQASAMGARFWAPYPFRDWAGHQFLFRTSEQERGFPTIFGRVMAKQARKWRDRALAIEFWIATCVVGGSFVVGLLRALGYLFD